MWQLVFTARARRDSKIAQKSVYKDRIESILRSLQLNPLDPSDNLEKLQPPRANIFSKRINRQHRVVYLVDKPKNLVKVLSLWTHYE
ncbi:MAG: Txe/YoeB family addiction module toxin [Coriobacteriales bacterium]|jgi:Txe/YoeB family toxin of toxin-antitoxin system|nr:Txe/YoeB family addiction module toxin [Coriobacteriales bacterium]